MIPLEGSEKLLWVNDGSSVISASRPEEMNEEKSLDSSKVS